MKKRTQKTTIHYNYNGGANPMMGIRLYCISCGMCRESSHSAIVFPPLVMGLGKAKHKVPMIMESIL